MREEATRFVGHSLLMVPFRAYAMGIQFVSTFFLARVLEAEGYGRWGLMLALSQWGYTFFLCWNTPALSRYGREEHLATGALRATFASRFLLYLPGLAALLAVAGGGSTFLAEYIHSPRSVLALVVLYALGISLSETVQYVLPAMGRSDLSAVVLALERTVALGLVALAWRMEILNPVTSLGAFLAASWLVNVPALAFLRKSFLPWTRDAENFKRCWAFCRPVLLIAPAGGVIGWIDLFVIDHFSTLQNVGRYFLAFQFFSAVSQMSFIITLASGPLTVLMVLKKRADLEDLLANRVQNLSVALGSAAALAATPVAWFVFAYVGREHAMHMREVWLLLMPGCIAAFTNATLGSYYVAREDTFTPGWIGVGRMIVNVGLDLALVPVIGAHGAAIAASTGALLQYAVLCRKLERFGVRSRGVFLRLLACLAPSALLALLPSPGSAPAMGVALLAALGIGTLTAGQVGDLLKYRRES